MSIDKSLRRKNSLVRARNVLTRGERIKVLQDEERWQDGRSPYNLPKVRVVKIVVKKVKKAKEEEGAAAEGAPRPRPPPQRPSPPPRPPPSPPPRRAARRSNPGAQATSPRREQGCFALVRAAG